VFQPEVREFYALEKMWSPSGAARGPNSEKQAAAGAETAKSA